MTQEQNSKIEATAPQELARSAAVLAAEKRGEDIVILDLRKFSIGCQFFVLVSATAARHVRALAEWIEDELQRRHGARLWHREGLTHASWILLDYVDVVIHIFQREARQYYLLERLWGDAPCETVASDAPGEAHESDEDQELEDEE
ncbi:MAG: ribosome silencing factor [Candidatus Eisenbacteria sp.]|nr:ribosome silencing factor [Candidatus Eisenbacteria bacterium]